MLPDTAWAGWGQAPVGWSDIKFGLVNDGKDLYNQRMQAAVSDGIQLEYRYTYINNGVQTKADPAKNAMSWLFTPWKDYVKDSQMLGMKSAFVIYMLQEDLTPAAATLAASANDAEFMRNYFTTLKLLAEKTKGQKPVFILEPDTWGYALQAGTDPATAKAVVNNLGGDFAFLSDLPNTYSGLAQALIRTLKHFAPDAYAGVLMSHWTPDSYDCAPPDIPNSNYGMPWRSPEDVDCAADRNIAFANKLLGTGADRGDFIGVEKNGHSAGYWYAMAGTKDAFARRYYWNDQQNSMWLRWCKRLGQGVNLPILGWQISIGNEGLPNACATGPLATASGIGSETGNCAFEDTFFPYFFKNVPAFLDAGFIGFMVGKGLADDVDYTYDTKDPTMGDKGWFFHQLKAFDKGRPYLKPGTAVREAGAAGGKFRTDDGVKLSPTGEGWAMTGVAGQASPRLLDSKGRETGSVRFSTGEWRIEAGSLASGIYWLEVPGKPTLALPRIFPRSR